MMTSHREETTHHASVCFASLNVSPSTSAPTTSFSSSSPSSLSSSSFTSRWSIQPWLVLSYRSNVMLQHCWFHFKSSFKSVFSKDNSTPTSFLHHQDSDLFPALFQPSSPLILDVTHFGSRAPYLSVNYSYFVRQASPRYETVFGWRQERVGNTNTI